LSTKDCEAFMKFCLHTCTGKSISCVSRITGTSVAAHTVNTIGTIVTTVRFKFTLVDIYSVTKILNLLTICEYFVKTDTVCQGWSSNNETKKLMLKICVTARSVYLLRLKNVTADNSRKL